MGRKDKIRKSLESLEKQIIAHEKKIREYEGKDDTLIPYWKKEIELRKKEKEKKQKMLSK